MSVDLTPNKDGGVLKEVLTPGTGSETPSAGSQVTVHYEGKFLDGKIFDSSVMRGEKFEFTLGKGQVIKGWDIAVATMKRDEKCRITCKPEYAYGKTGSPPKIPPNTTLVFDITLYSWQEEDVTEDNSGVYRSVLKNGTGYSSPGDFRSCSVEITGSHDGRVFDKRTLDFNLGEWNTVDIPPGVELALKKMHKGEKSRLTLKPKHGWPLGFPKFGIPAGATLVYEVNLIKFEKDLEEWDMEAKEKIEQAILLKNRATEFYQKGEFKIAKGLYEKAEALLKSNQGYSDQESAEREKTVLALLLNLGLTSLKIGNYHETVSYCEKALEMDAQNVKALFRRGQALLLINEPDAAKVDFERVLAIEPGNKAAAAQITECKRKAKALRDKEKKIFTNMFDKFARKDTEGVYHYGWWNDSQKQPVVTETVPEEKEDVEELKREKKKQLEHLKRLAEQKKKELQATVEQGDIGEGERAGHDVEIGGVGAGREGGGNDGFREGEPGRTSSEQGRISSENVEQ